MACTLGVFSFFYPLALQCSLWK